MAEDPARQKEAGIGGAAGTTDTTGTLIAGEQWGPPLVQNIPQAPLQGAWVIRERLAMLATARRSRLGESGWAAISGLCASLPATVHDLAEAYWIDNPVGLSATRLIDVGVTLFFLAFTVTALTRDRGQSAQQILQEILNPPIQAPNKRSWSAILSDILSKLWS